MEDTNVATITPNVLSGVLQMFFPVGTTNLDEDFVIDQSKKKIYNTDTLIGNEVPIKPPTVEEKVWYYYNSDIGVLTHIWNPVKQQWENLISNSYDIIRVTESNLILDEDHTIVFLSPIECQLPNPKKYKVLVLVNHSNKSIRIKGSLNGKDSSIVVITTKSVKLHSDGNTWYTIN